MTGSAGPGAQLRALLVLRWTMIRSTSIRVGIAVATALPIFVVMLGMLGLDAVPDEKTVSVGLTTPTLYLGFVILAVLVPLVSGGGYELYPADHLVAYPIHPSTVFRGTVTLAPVNLAWVLNVIAVLVVTGFSTGPLAWAPTTRSLLTATVFVLVATVAGHALGWVVVGLRQRRNGRILTNALGISIACAGLLVIWTGHVIDLLDVSPTRFVLFASSDGYQGRYGRWSVFLVCMAVCGLACLRLGEAATAWALRRPGDHASRAGGQTLTRRPTRGNPLRALIAIDHASVWRSTPLRRGVLVLIVVPAVAVSLANLSWQSLILVPGLIAAGAGLLFGINAFTLDSSGALWLATLPRWPDSAFVAKAIVFAEIAVAAVGSALIGGALRNPHPDSMAQVTAAVASGISCAAIVVALGMRSSLQHPHRADLQASRDTPATPGVMAAQSVRFAGVTSVTSLCFVALGSSGAWWLPILGLVAVAAVCGLHLISTARAWQHPHVRSHVVLTVSGG